MLSTDDVTVKLLGRLHQLGTYFIASNQELSDLKGGTADIVCRPQESTSCFGNS